MSAAELDLTTGTELERLRAENARLRAQLAEGRHRPDGRLRAVAVFVCLALAATTFAGSVVGIWARRTVFNDEVFAARAEAIAADPAVQAALAGYLTDELMTVVNPQALFQEVLPERGRLLAAPLSNAVRGFVNERVAVFLASDSFARLWAEVVARGHTAMVRLLRGESQIISTRGDALVINLIPVINAALARIGELSPELFGRRIDLPTVTADDIPDVARQKVSTALGRDLSPTFGVIVLQGGGDELDAAQRAVRTFDLLLFVLIGLTLILVPLALWLAPDRRRAVLRLALAMGIATIVVRRLALGLQQDVLDRVPDPANRGAAAAIADILAEPLLDATLVVLWVLLAVAALAWLTGPSRAAVWLRSLVSGLFASLTAMAGAAPAGSATGQAVAWARDHATALQVAGVATVAVVLLVTDLSWLGTLLLATLLGLYLLAIWRLPPGLEADDASRPAPG